MLLGLDICSLAQVLMHLPIELYQNNSLSSLAGLNNFSIKLDGVETL